MFGRQAILNNRNDSNPATSRFKRFFSNPINESAQLLTSVRLCFDDFEDLPHVTDLTRGAPANSYQMFPVSFYFDFCSAYF